MKHHVLSAIALTCLLAASASYAISFTVTTDTSSLIGHPAGPFSLDFQFIDGSGLGDGNNSVEISGFDFHGGAWIGADPNIIALSDTVFFSEFFQTFTPGSLLSFNVSLSTMADVGGTPDQFSFAILDSGLSEIPTHGLGDALLSVDIDSANPQVQSFGFDAARTTIDIPAPIVNFGPPAPVPDSGVPNFLFVGICVALFYLRFKQEKKRGLNNG